MSNPKSVFIAIDGIDGVGKSTQIAFLSDLLTDRGHRCLLTRDPGSTEIGKRLRELLLESDLTMNRRTEAMLFMASRCEMVETTIRPALRDGISVISDRFLLANVVYQSIGDSHAPGVDPSLLWELGGLANGGLRPDLTVLLDMPAARSMERIEGPRDRMEARGEAYMERVRQAFLEQLPKASEATVVVNADQPVEAVSAELKSAVLEQLAQYG
ncbi:dTMP kinase [Rhodopirellula sp. MGV]|uniref:dTMP kinase n=1 Tax=Rhodopirellula sp. MGV TaxID=2023130 RepID=UPI000B972C96|nr:dTMP kinase [Rhodopirellula sp. MGV]OYP32343.1 dTMP kinase [Rhodopirellula sp. MGV]PNY35874.1 dTMP kinase [Rhodopirellula baltica]